MKKPYVKINYGIRPGWSQPGWWWELHSASGGCIAMQQGRRDSEHHARRAWETTLRTINTLRQFEEQERKP